MEYDDRETKLSGNCAATEDAEVGDHEQWMEGNVLCYSLYYHYIPFRST